jgi:hypothetical protein
MPYQIIIGTVETIKDRLNSALVLGPYLGDLPVGGRTLIFASPMATVTFSGAAGALLSVEDIAAEINATVGLSGTASTRRYEYGTAVNNPSVRVSRLLVLQRDGGFTLDKDGTANPYLAGLPTASDEDLVQPGAVEATDVVTVNQGTSPGHLILVLAP